MIQKKKPQFPQIQDVDIMDKFQSKKQIKAIPYSHSQSIQEEDEQSSSQINLFGHSKPSFLMTFPQQPRDCQGSEEIKAPTIITNLLSNKSQEQLAIKKECRQHNPFKYLDESSEFSSKMNSIRSIFEDKKPLQINQERVKLLVNQMRVKFLNLIHYSKYNDPILTQEYQELSPLKYHYFTMYIFLSTTLSNILSCTFIPLVQFFDVSQLTTIISQIVYGLTNLIIIQDLIFQRGPYKMQRGVIKVDFKDSNKKLLDILRMFFLSFAALIEIDERIKLVSVLLMMLFQFIRQAENFENIYRSTHHFIFILQLWISIIISFSCIYQVSHQEEDPNLYFCLTLAVSLLTHSGTISTNKNAFLISFYMIICYLCLAYTTMILYVWMKPEIEIEEEKQKLLKGFVERFREKCENDGLLKRCYSYLEFRIDEDLNKTKDQLTKKLSPELEDEIDISLRSTMIDKIELLNRFSPQFKQQLIYEIEQVTFNPEDNIIIEHQIEDLGLFYILKGQVKVQFQGSSFGNNKRAVTTLQEGSTFGQYSFITGIPSNISIFSSGVTTLMKIKRSDFIQTISNYPQDNEIFCTLKDNAFYNQKLFECYYCKIRGNYIIECRHLQYFPQRINTIEKYLYTAKQQRRQFVRKLRKYFAWQDMNLNQDRARQYANKQSQDFVSDELPEPSQLPYSESKESFKLDQTYQSVSFVSNSLAQRNQSPDQYQSVSESFDQFNFEYECSDEQTIHIQEPQSRSISKNSNKTTLKTAGFPINGEPNNQASAGNNITVIEKDDRDILNQLQEAQMNKDRTILFPAVRNNSQSKQKFQYLKESSQGILLKEDHTYQQQQQQQQLSHPTLKQSIRQPSSRSQTYSNSLSKDVSNNPSSNSKQNKSQKLSMQYSQSRFQDQLGLKKQNSSKSLSDQNKQNNNRSLKSTTRQSTPNQISQFHAISTPENQGYFINDLLFNNFETMKEYKIYYPHNNYAQVIDRYIRFLDSNRQNQFKRKKLNHSTPYSIKCFVASKIKRVKKLLQN
ncbi:unnamed protein product (macronuclear) [Paramecium tetraurelia]|uniref:Cyclic nucleotide-binding domain-containing protein n=1 Tax=Paramecium tetraurelia TaxID=5888 RepID=A0BNG0_PARTE|nr:uncharacterized protein GSPATT00030715001 [Paramecium tetraurelia]CAK60077.1 unnamed protein product [Paramecium tetraurelia]|eukprot:XP_001427475.1 hypothetical protein (macronuclear) [Paramecium tetraurelia strain d4-2]